MSISVSVLRCPICGAVVKIDDYICEYCGNELTFSCANNKEDPKQGMFFLKRGMYEQAQKYYLNLISDGVLNAEIFYLAAISLFEGKKPFLAKKATVKKAEEFILHATELSPKGKYYLLWAYIKEDYYERKSLISKPDISELKRKIVEFGISESDIREINLFLK